MLLENRIAFITGAGQGNGAAIALGLAAEGARVIATDINGDAASATAAQIKERGGEAWSFALDVTDAAGCMELAREISASIGDVSVLVNNAGICPRNTIDSPDLRASWDAAMKVNLEGTLNVSLAFVGALRATKGSIINMASIASFVSTATSVSYSTSKAAVRMFTQNLAQELAKDGVRVNAIAPGTFATPMTAATRNNPERSAKFLARIPMGRYGEPEELVGPTLFLASSMSSYMTGATIVVDGGYLAV
ncbi:NAD(P)-dependent dehydrogenase, short-chain alcohol dehydrogenase family [Rhizobium multihospitium]|uniref:NAD(P)-dependent dehydrogenase, short-chain alcohol dehydrogenase family n=1 Tax=Rhizobium multihospitium TaxID=410764 RepID=A0A1C3X595_9HYPH|nr:NAD(P)-dependent dehydrogenase, short-chain alcohol dehydrogenase family [Rhizobium multihospitium]